MLAVNEITGSLQGCAAKTHQHHQHHSRAVLLLLHFGLPTVANHLSQPGLLLPGNYSAFTFDYSEVETTIEVSQAKICSFYKNIYQCALPC